MLNSARTRIEKRGEHAMPTRGHCAILHAEASFVLVKMKQQCKTWSCLSRNWKEHRCCFWFPKIKCMKWLSDFPIHVLWEVEYVPFKKRETSERFLRWTSVERALKVFSRGLKLYLRKRPAVDSSILFQSSPKMLIFHPPPVVPNLSYLKSRPGV